MGKQQELVEAIAHYLFWQDSGSSPDYELAKATWKKLQPMYLHRAVEILNIVEHHRQEEAK